MAALCAANASSAQCHSTAFLYPPLDRLGGCKNNGVTADYL